MKAIPSQGSHDMSKNARGFRFLVNRGRLVLKSSVFFPFTIRYRIGWPAKTDAQNNVVANESISAVSDESSRWM